MTWKSIKSAPYQRVVWVRNEQMKEPVKATRGYHVPGVGVHSDNTFFTTAFTPHPHFPTPAGNLVCPTEWKECDQ